MLKTLLKPLASLKLTVVLLALSMVLVYAGTWAQVDAGIWQVQKKYFHSFFVWIPIQTLFPRSQTMPVVQQMGFPMLGGYTLGTLLLVNLLSAHFVRFQFNAKRIGIFMIHGGLILLLVGEGISSSMQKESQMPIEEGSSANYSYDTREVELAIVEVGPRDEKDTQYTIGSKLLAPQTTITDARLPFDVRIGDLYANSTIVDAARHPEKPSFEDGRQKVTLAKAEPSSGTDSRIDTPGAFVTVLKRGQEVGTFLLKSDLNPQPLAFDGQAYTIALRFRRYYKPYRMYLDDFSFDRYTGTSMARNFSSDVRLVDPVHNETRQVRISMNKPLRYRGETFYQQSFDPRTEKTTYLQIVSNPGFWLPYAAIGLAGFGLVDHFLIALSAFLLRRSLTALEILGGHFIAFALFGVGAAGYFILGLWGIVLAAAIAVALIGVMIWYYVATVDTPPPLPRARGASQTGKPVRESAKVVEMAPSSSGLGTRLLPAFAALLCIGAIVLTAIPRSSGGMFNIDKFAQLPISFDGRVQPMDTLARNALKVMRGRETAIQVQPDPKDPASKKETDIPAAQWLLEVFAENPAVRDYLVLRIDHPDIKGLIGLDEKQKFFSVNQVAQGQEKLLTAIGQAREAERENSRMLSNYQRALLELEKKISLYDRLSNLDAMYIVPPGSRSEWTALGMLPINTGGGQAAHLRDLGIEGLQILGSTPESQLNRPDRAPARWLAEAMTLPERGRRERVFRITNAELIKTLGLNPAQGFYSMQEIAADREKRAALIESAGKAEPAAQTPLQAAAADVASKLDLYRRIESMTGQVPVPVVQFLAMVNAYQADRPQEFNRAVDASETTLQAQANQNVKASFETWFNRFSPFGTAQIFYIIVFVAAAGSWLGWQKTLSRTAFWVLCFALMMHTFGLAARIYISGRPPVTNLASSAIFIGWGAAVFGAVLELIFRNGLGSVAAAVLAFPTLLIANRLSLSGDTMAVLVAVLDTNIWLTTHVIAITLGYSATFLAGLLGIIYIILGVFTSALDRDTQKQLLRMIWSITCFAILFSFVGTVLGGIWADQSWGRFWGWDPKENGAVLIVLANAIVLHARWAGWARERGLATLAIFGNIITSWSWFGTNMLGVGLHSYGFMSAAAVWLLIFVASQLILIGIGLIPMRHWGSAQRLGIAPPPFGPTSAA